jgi:hypothetical protein
MGLTASNKGGSHTQRPPIPKGRYLATLVGIYDIGTQPPKPNAQYGPKYQVILCWELADEDGNVLYTDYIDVEEPEPVPLLKTDWFTLSFHENGLLRPAVESITGESMPDDDYDLTQLLGVQCCLTVGHWSNAGKSGDEITGYMTLGQRDPEWQPVTEPAFFNMDDAIYEGALPEWLPEWVGKKVQQSLEWGQAFGRHPEPAARNGNGRGNGNGHGHGRAPANGNARRPAPQNGPNGRQGGPPARNGANGHAPAGRAPAGRPAPPASRGAAPAGRQPARNGGPPNRGPAPAGRRPAQAQHDQGDDGQQDDDIPF